VKVQPLTASWSLAPSTASAPPFGRTELAPMVPALLPSKLLLSTVPLTPHVDEPRKRTAPPPALLSTSRAQLVKVLAEMESVVAALPLVQIAATAPPPPKAFAPVKLQLEMAALAPVSMRTAPPRSPVNVEHAGARVGFDK
jgi:hypothetical protein